MKKSIAIAALALAALLLAGCGRGPQQQAMPLLPEEQLQCEPGVDDPTGLCALGDGSAYDSTPAPTPLPQAPAGEQPVVVPGDTASTARVLAGCMTSGCSGEVCQNAGAEPVMTTCGYDATAACYQAHGVCGPDATGHCSWQPTPQLQACLAQGTAAPAVQ